MWPCSGVAATRVPGERATDGGDTALHRAAAAGHFEVCTSRCHQIYIYIHTYIYTYIIYIYPADASTGRDLSLFAIQ